MVCYLMEPGGLEMHELSGSPAPKIYPETLIIIGMLEGFPLNLMDFAYRLSCSEHSIAGDERRHCY